MAGNLARGNEGVDTARLDDTTLHTPKGIHGRQGGEQERKGVSGKHDRSKRGRSLEKEKGKERSERGKSCGRQSLDVDQRGW